MLLFKKWCKMDKSERKRECCNRVNKPETNVSRSLSEVESRSIIQTHKVVNVNYINGVNGEKLIVERPLRSLPLIPTTLTSTLPSTSTSIRTTTVYENDSKAAIFKLATNKNNNNNNNNNNNSNSNESELRQQYRENKNEKLGPTVEVFSSKQQQHHNNKKTNNILIKRHKNDLRLTESNGQQLIVIDREKCIVVKQNETAGPPFIRQSQPLPQQPQQQQQQQYANRIKRRLRLHQLHSIRFQKRPLSTLSLYTNADEKNCSHRISSSDISDSSSNSDSDTDKDSSTETNNHYHNHNVLIHSTNSYVKDIYCPDLLNACSLISQDQQSNDNCSIYSSINIDNHLNCHQYETINRNRRILVQRVHDHAGTESEDLIIDASSSSYSVNDNNNEHIKVKNSFNQNEYIEEGKSNQRLIQTFNEMGQSLSLRRPRISLTWFLRQQQPSQQQQHHQPQQQEEKEEHKEDEEDEEDKNQNQQEFNNKENHDVKHLESIDAKIERPIELDSNQSNSNNEKNEMQKNLPTNITEDSIICCATTSTSTSTLTPTPTSTSTSTSTAQAVLDDVGSLITQNFFSDKNLLEYHREDMCIKPASKNLLFVCTPQRMPESMSTSTEALAFAKKRYEIRKKLATKKTNLHSDSYSSKLTLNSTKVMIKPTQEGQHFSLSGSSNALKNGSYSEPSLVAASEGNPRRHRHRKRRERYRNQKFGYEIRNVEEFLTKCSLLTPANIPMVLSTSCTLYQTRPGGYQTEISLPLGTVVNAIFKNQIWLYVQTPHGEEGYVSYHCCMPLGILPPEARGQGVGSAKPPPCWESNCDIFPHPCGNMTDSEKELHFIGGARSEGARTPHLKSLPPLKTADNVYTVISQSGKNLHALNSNSRLCGEHQVDKLYLKAATQSKRIELKPAYAQLKVLNHGTIHKQSTAINVNDEYVTLLRRQQQKSTKHKTAFNEKLLKHTTSTTTTAAIDPRYLTNGQNGQHLHPNEMNIILSTTTTTTTMTTTTTTATTTSLTIATPIASTFAKTIPKISTISANGVVVASPTTEVNITQQQQQQQQQYKPLHENKNNGQYNLNNQYQSQSYHKHQHQQQHHHHHHHHPQHYNYNEQQKQQQQLLLLQPQSRFHEENVDNYYQYHHHHHHHHQHHNSTQMQLNYANSISQYNQQQQQRQQQQQEQEQDQQYNNHGTHCNVLNALRRSTAYCGQRQTLVAIIVNYTTTDGVHLRKGDIVTLCECRETKDHRQWFYVRTRDGRQGYIPAEVAGHGFL